MILQEKQIREVCTVLRLLPNRRVGKKECIVFLKNGSFEKSSDFAKKNLQLREEYGIIPLLRKNRNPICTISPAG